MQTGPGGKKQELFAKKVTPLDSVVSAHPQNVCLSLPTDLKKLRSIGPFYLAIIELNPKQRMGVNKSDSYCILDVDRSR